MKLNSGTVHRLKVPMHASYGSAHHRDFTEMESTLVTLSGDGVTGIGTADATPGYSIQSHNEIESALVTDLLPQVLDKTPDNPNQLCDVVPNIEAHPNAVCALEMAYLDWYGKTHEVAVTDILAGARRKRVPLNGWVGIDDPDVMAEEARRWLADGYDSIKIKLSGDPDADINRVQAVCEAVCDEGMDVRADVNAGYDVETGIYVARELEQFPLAHLEQPVPKDDLDGLKRVTESTSTTIMADESIVTAGDAFEIIRRSAADRIKIKILRMGGVLKTRQVLDAAELAGVSCVLGHGFGLTPATSTELSLAAAHGNVFGPVEAVGPLKMEEEPFSTLQIADGMAVLATGHGHGIDLIEDILPEFATQSITVNP